VARSRNLKPGFFTNDALSECEPLARILFAGLWTIADREGRMEDRPKKIKAELLPYDNCEIESLLKQLETSQFIQRYEVKGNKYIQVLKFSEHQNPHMKEAESTIPAPGETDANPKPAPDKPGLNPHPSPDSLLPHPSPRAPYKNGFDILNLISEDGLMDARSQAPGWDIQGYLVPFYNTRVSSGEFERPRHPDKAFPAWCKSFTKGKRPQ
jgi:hypothetical protein